MPNRDTSEPSKHNVSTAISVQIERDRGTAPPIIPER
jgi:hypothetical protein